MKRDTLPSLLLYQASKKPDAVALREKEFGIWKRVTWSDYLVYVRNFSLGLISLGLKEDDKVSILSENCREWLYAELGTMSAGGVGVGIYPTSPYTEVKYVVEHSQSSFVVCEDQEQTDKILEVINELPLVKKIIVIDMKGLRHYRDPRIISFEEVQKLGEEFHKKDASLFESLVLTTKAEDIAFLIYTSGTTGFPKGAMITHKNITAATKGTVEACGIVEKDSVVSYLPLCHVAEQIFSVFLSLYSGITVNFAESVRTIQEDLREIAPTVFLGVPRIWEKLQSSIEIKIKETTKIQRALFKWCYERGVKYANFLLEGKIPPLLDRVINLICYLLMFRALQNYVGLRKVRFCFSAAAAISPEVLRFFHAIGIRVKEGYGMTECTGLSFIHMGDDIKLGTVGKPVPGLEFKIAEDGELLKRGDAVFAGYFRNSQATSEVIKDGWLHTGDIAELTPAGHLKIVDRKKSIIITAGGKNVSPSLIENALKVSPYIKEAIVLGEGERFLSALIQIDFENVGKWATDVKLPYTNFKSLAMLPQVYELIKDEVEKANQSVATVEQIRKFKLLEKELDHDDDELTATMKVRRKNIYKKFAEVIEEIYGRK